MRRIQVRDVSNLVRSLSIKANLTLRTDVLSLLKKATAREKNRRAKAALNHILENARIAKSDRIPICQDTGLVVVFIEIGRDVRIAGGSLKKAVDKGVKDGYSDGYFRRSVVSSPIKRTNTGTNTPAILHTDMVEGDALKVWVMPKGFGSENKSALRMLMPGAGEDGIVEFVLDTVRKAGPEACPPFVVGIGIGGTFDYAAYLAKKAMLRRIDKANPERSLLRLERKIIRKINDLRIGPMGLGGDTTVLGVNILSHATHIAGLPVAVNINCHATRSAYGEL